MTAGAIAEGGAARGVAARLMADGALRGGGCVRRSIGGDCTRTIVRAARSCAAVGDAAGTADGTDAAACSDATGVNAGAFVETGRGAGGLGPSDLSMIHTAIADNARITMSAMSTVRALNPGSYDRPGASDRRDTTDV
jgi:hypothetical protein